MHAYTAHAIPSGMLVALGNWYNEIVESVLPLEGTFVIRSDGMHVATVVNGEVQIRRAS